jgi:integrase
MPMTLNEAFAKYLRTYQRSGRRGYAATELRVRVHLRPFFGPRESATITADDLDAYVDARAERGAKNATIRAELAALRRSLKLARVPVPPLPEYLTPAPPRRGFIDPPQFIELRRQLPEPLQSPFTFAYITGWRLRSEVLPLKKTEVDFRQGWVHLLDSKNGEPRQFPLDFNVPDIGNVRALLEQAFGRAPVISPLVFHRFGGKPIKYVYGSWRNACKAAGLKRLPHDFRRSAVRNLIRAGVDQRTAMELTGHKTVAVFHRYRIVNETDLRDAVKKLERFLETDVSGARPSSRASVNDRSAG